MEDLLGDTDTYTVIKKILLKNSQLVYVSCFLDGEILGSSCLQHTDLHCSDGVLPRAYGLLKIHKENCPLRLIVFSPNNPLYHLAAFFHRTMLKSFPTPDSHVSNSFELVNKFTNISIPVNFILVSLDVIFLFTNIPTEMALDSGC